MIDEFPPGAVAPVRPRGVRRWLQPRVYPTLILLAMFGLVATSLAWLSFGLLNVAMDNLSFLQRHGARAIAEGGLMQSAEIALQSFAVLMLYLGFRGLEAELIARWIGRKGD